MIRFPAVVFGSLFGRSIGAAVRFRMRSPVVLFVLAAVAGCHPAPRTQPTVARTEPVAGTPVARAAPASALHPDRVLAREVLVAMTRFTDEACACTDATCASAVQARLGEWASPRLARIQTLKPTADENRAAEAIQLRMQGCMAQFTAPSVMPLTGALILQQLHGWKDRVCACTDKACVADVQRQMLAWAMENMDAMKGVEPTEDEDAEADRLDGELATCIARIESATLDVR